VVSHARCSVAGMRTEPSSAPRLDARETCERRALGRLGERLAAAHLRRLGFSLVAQNVRTRHGEIDLIAFDGRTLVFAEVKARRAGGRSGPIRPDQDPLAALRPRQRLRLRRLATAWLHEHRSKRPAAECIRFDAIGVVVDRSDTPLRVDHIEGAW
jgi:putative endonuclease